MSRKPPVWEPNTRINFETDMTEAFAKTWDYIDEQKASAVTASQVLLTGYEKPTTTGPIEETDSVLLATGKLESQLGNLATVATHDKAGTVHSLVLDKTATAGIQMVQFTATADYAEGDTWLVDGVTYSAKLQGEDGVVPDKLFVAGDMVSVMLEPVGKRLGFKSGGGVTSTLPPQITNLFAMGQNAAAFLSWQLPSDTSALAGLVLTRKAGSVPQNVNDGVKIQLSPTVTTYTNTGLLNGTTYHYRAFPYNSKKQYQTEYCVAQATPTPGVPLGDLPIGTKIKDTGTKYYNKPIIWKIADKNHSGYPANSVTLITDQIITLKCFDGKEPSSSNSDRRSSGNNRYIYANIRRWLNSPAGAGAWYAAQHATDSPPIAANCMNGANPYDAQAGFLNTFGNAFRNALLTTTLIVAKNTVTDGGGSETFSDKLFLASNTEVGLTNENGIAEGSRLGLFSDNASRVATLTAEAASNGDGTAGAAWYWWLRTPRASQSYNPNHVVPSGALNGAGHAYFGIGGARPLCSLPSALYVLPQPDTDGAYILIM